MGRQYAHIKQYYSIIQQLQNEGKSYREIGEELGFSREQVKECMRRPRRLAEKRKQSVPKRKGRPPIQEPASWAALCKEVKRLRMENEILRDFLKATERM